MSHEMTALAMLQRGIKPATKIVLYWLADHYNSETHKCFPSIARLADCCEMSEQSVRNQLAILESKKLIKRKHSFKDGRQTSNNYALLLEYPSTKEPSKNKRGEAQNIGGTGVQNFDPNLVRNNLVRNNTSKLCFDENVFSFIWKIYPRKIKRKEAEKEFAKASLVLPPQQIAEIIELQCKQYSKTDIRYIPHLHNWLADERWNDEHLVKAYEYQKKIR